MSPRLERTVQMFFETIDQIASQLATVEEKREAVIDA
jgi:hypothetical protein